VENKPSHVRQIIKWVVSLALLVVVFQYVDGLSVKELISRMHPGWLGAGFFLFIGSMLLSALRLNIHYQCIGLNLSAGTSIRRYWIGQFYDRIMPTGNGAALNAFMLNKQFGIRIKDILLAGRLDRLSGIVSLIFLAAIGALTMNSDTLGVYYYVFFAALFLTIPLYSFVIGKYFYSFHSSFWLINFHSLAVAFAQVLSAYFVLRACGVSGFFLEYQVFFIVGAALAVLPFSIGGLGVREIVFVLGSSYVGLDVQVGFVVALVFFLFQLLTAMAGGFLRLKSESPLSSPSKKPSK